MKAYIKVDATKELPEKEGWYTVYIKNDEFGGQSYFHRGKFEYRKSDYWLKEIDLPEIMIEFAKICDGISEFGHQGNSKYEEYLKEFLAKKGIITIE